MPIVEYASGNANGHSLSQALSAFQAFSIRQMATDT